MPSSPRAPILAYVEAVPYWRHEVRLKHLMTPECDAFHVGTAMTRMGEVLQGNPLFLEFAELPAFFEEDDLQAANELLDRLYDYCDKRRIWLS